MTSPNQAELLLQAGTGSVGQELISRGHRLPLNSGSINGRAAVEKRSVVIPNTTTSLTFRPNPLLPETRSEMAIPLMVGNKVLGVLDLQSRQIGELNEDMLIPFEALSGQLAIAIQNANLLAESNQARAEVESQRRLVRAGWEDYLDAIHKPEQTGFAFEDNKITSFSEDLPAGEGAALTVPITIGGESLGTFVVEMDIVNRNPQNVELVKIVARQVAQQIENQRLLESAQRYRFEAEQASRRLTREGWQDYMDARNNQSLGYLYNLKEVTLVNQDTQNLASEPGVDLPLKVRDETVGKLSILGLDSVDSESLTLANAVAERLGAHIESLRQYDRTQSALTQSEKLFDASRRLTQASNLQELVKSVVETLDIPEINRAVLGTIAYDTAGELESMTIAGNWWNGSGTEADAVGKYFSTEALRKLSLSLSGAPVFVNDALSDKTEDPTVEQAAREMNFRARAVLPLLLGTRQIGILILEGEEPHTFTQEETRLFSALAPQIATVLENRRQFERAQHQADRESMLNIINQKIQAATSVEAVLQIAARELGHALGAPRTIAQLSIKK